MSTFVVFSVVSIALKGMFCPLIGQLLYSFPKLYPTLAVIIRHYSTVSVTIRHNPTRQKITQSILSTIMDIQIVIFFVTNLIFGVGFPSFDSLQKQKSCGLFAKLALRILVYPHLSYFILIYPCLSSSILRHRKQLNLHCC